MATPKVGDIIKDISDDVKLLVRDEIELAKSELIPSAKQAGLGAGLFGAAGYSRDLAPCCSSSSRPRTASSRPDCPPGLAFLIVGVALLIIAAVLALIGKTRIKKVTPPERTIAAATETRRRGQGGRQERPRRGQGAADRGHRSSTSAPCADRSPSTDCAADRWRAPAYATS